MVRRLRNNFYWFSTICDELEQIRKHSSLTPPCTTYLVLLWLLRFLHPWTGSRAGEFLSSTQKNDFLNCIPAFYHLHLDTEALSSWSRWKLKKKGGKQDGNNSYQICGNVHAGPESWTPLKKTGTASDWSVCCINSSRLRCPRPCTVLHRCYWWESEAEPAPDPSERVWSVVPQTCPTGVGLNQSVSAVKPVPHVYERKR